MSTPYLQYNNRSIEEQIRAFIKLKGSCTDEYTCHNCIIKESGACYSPYSATVRYKKAVELGITYAILTEEEAFTLLL